MESFCSLVKYSQLWKDTEHIDIDIDIDKIKKQLRNTLKFRR